ncbi:MAG: type II secretion system protein [Armatimonadota bacterium]|nr:MAG: type II secretion system protein [Armatimonadota bacterium]
MHRTPNAKDDVGMTLVELLVVIFIISVLAGAMVPVFYRVQSKSRETWCISNMRQLLMALQMYLADYDEIPLNDAGRVVEGDEVIREGLKWGTTIYPYAGRNEEVFLCPVDPTRGEKYRHRAGLPCSWAYLYSRGAVEHLDGRGKTVASESPVLMCHWHFGAYGIFALGRKDTSVELAPRHKALPLHVVLE